MTRPGATKPGTYDISVIVPMLNEASALSTLLPHLGELREQGCEILLVDGGSTDSSAEMALEGGFRVAMSERGRALQMNAGARLTSGALLVFLHADTRLPESGIAAVHGALSSGRGCWGRFDVNLAGRSRLLPVVGMLMNLRSRLTGIATGDQAIFVTRRAFDVARGFPDQPLMEDIALSRALLRQSRPVCLRSRVETSGRRWDTHGACRTVLLMWGLRAAYALGFPPGQLARFYR